MALRGPKRQNPCISTLGADGPERPYEAESMHLRKATRAALFLDPAIIFSLLVGERELLESMDDLTFTDLGVEDSATSMVVKRLAIQVLTASRDGAAKMLNNNNDAQTQAPLE